MERTLKNGGLTAWSWLGVFGLRGPWNWLGITRYSNPVKRRCNEGEVGGDSTDPADCAGTTGREVKLLVRGELIAVGDHL